MTIRCPSAECLSMLVNDALPPNDLASVRDHLTDCHLCQESLEQLIDDPTLRLTVQSTKSVPLSLELSARLLALAKVELRKSNNRNHSISLGPSKDPLQLGSLDDYEVISLCGQGGMAFVFEGFDRKLTRRVAINLLRPDRSTEADRTRFLREAQAVAGLRHDHLLPVFSTGNAPDGTPYFAMPFLENSSLRDLMRGGKWLTPRRSAEIVLQISDALAAAHSANLIHRDVKPENILIDPMDGRAKLTDFGLVRTMDCNHSGSTESRMILETPEYMAPEQWNHPETADARCDIYGLGITLYELFTGQTPFRGQPDMIAHQVNELEPISPRQINPQLSRDLEAICLKAINKQPTRRYAAAAEFRDDLRRWLDNRPILARPASPWERLVKAARRKPALAGLMVALLLAVISGFAGISWMWKRAESNATIAKSNEYQARLQLKRAEEHRDIAKEAIDKFYRGIYEKGLLNDPNSTVQKKELIVDALRFYQRMLVHELKDPNLIQSAAETAAKIGLLTRDVEEISAAIPYFIRSVELARSAVAADPTNVERKLLLLRSIDTLGATWHRMLNFGEATACYRESSNVWSELVQAFPTEVTYRRNLTAFHVNLANLAFQSGDRDAAKVGYTAALEQFQILGKQMENQSIAQLDLARIEYNLRLVSDSLEENIEWMEKSCNHRRAVLSQNAGHGLARRDFVKSSESLARGYSQIPEKKTRGLDVISEGIFEARIALKSDPNNLEFLSQLTTSLQTAGVLAHELNRHEEADSYFNEMDLLILRLLEKDRVRFRIDVANWLAERVEIRLHRNQLAQANLDRQLAIELIAELLPTLSEQSPTYEEFVAIQHKLNEK